MDEKTYGMCSLTHEEDQYTFGSYTTFKHGDNQPCQMWKINDGQDKDKLNLHFTFNTDQVLPKHNLSGPAACTIVKSINVSSCALVLCVTTSLQPVEKYAEETHAGVVQCNASH